METETVVEAPAVLEAVEIETVVEAPAVQPWCEPGFQSALQRNLHAVRTGSVVAEVPVRVPLPREKRVAAGSKVSWAVMKNVEELRERGSNEADGRKKAVKSNLRLAMSLAYQKSEVQRLLKERDAARGQLRAAKEGLRKQEQARKPVKGAVTYDKFLHRIRFAFRRGWGAWQPLLSRGRSARAPPAASTARTLHCHVLTTARSALAATSRATMRSH